MKIDPIVYRHKGETHHVYKNVYNGPNETVHNRDILLTCQSWKYGAMAIFSIVEEFSVGGFVQPYQRKLVEVTYYDKDNIEQQDLMMTLADNEVRGLSAERLSNNLLMSLFIYSDYVRELLPELHAFFTKFAKTNNQTIKTGVIGMISGPFKLKKE